jgi:hypothetical protein
MRLQALMTGILASTIAAGCSVVFGISSGEYDPDPFDRDAGDGGGPPDVEAPPPCTPALLDDLEDGDGAIIECTGRSGSWYTYNDGTRGGVQTPLPGRPFVPVSPGDGTSRYAAHVAGSGFTTRGAGMGFDLSFVPGGTKSSYDAHAYSGLTFRAKAKEPIHIYVNFPDVDTDPAGGVCSGTGCSDHYGKGIDITTEWAQYTVKFDALSPDGWGVPKPAAFDPAHIYSVEFHTAKTTVFDMLVDDIAFAP